jgi:hypothetical protein
MSYVLYGIKAWDTAAIRRFSFNIKALGQFMPCKKRPLA